MFFTLPSFASITRISEPFKRAQLGLFHGKQKQYGNNVPFSKHKTRRTWLPNVQTKRLSSDALGQLVKVKLTTRALKTIKKHGGFDNYLLKTKSDLLGWEGMRLRIKVREALSAKREMEETQAKLREERERLLKEVEQLREDEESDRIKALDEKVSARRTQILTEGILGPGPKEPSQPPQTPP